MHIRKRGKNFQFLRKLDTKDGKVKHKMIGKIPVDTESIGELEGGELWEDILTRREQGQLEEYLEKYHAAKEERTVPSKDNTIKVADEVIRKIQRNADADYNPIEFDAENFVEAYKLLTKSLVDDGHISAVATTAMNACTGFIDEYEIEDNEAEAIHEALKNLKKSMNKQGFTVAWLKHGVSNRDVIELDKDIDENPEDWKDFLQDM